MTLPHTEAFDPTNAACWRARGRPTAHAEALADAWRRLPDLPCDAPADARMARIRERVQVLRPLQDMIARDIEATRQRTNFAFVENQIAAGSPDKRHHSILTARDALGYDWDQAVRYADGHYAAQAGWDARPPAGSPKAPSQDRLIRAYDQGFRDGGGHPDDIFDAARRAFNATDPDPARQTAGARSKPISRPPPSDWLKPSDALAPVSWNRRVIIMGAAELTDESHGLLAILQQWPGANQAISIIAGGELGFARLSDPTGPLAPPNQQLQRLLAHADIADILVAANGPDLDFLDACAASLPLARNMERTRNSALQQRAELRIWLSRGRAPSLSLGAGHIRWSKATAGLSGRLGDFTARYVGPDPLGGHRIQIVDAHNELATGCTTPNGRRLDPELIISNRKHLREAMRGLLREFAASLRLGSVR